MKPFIFAVNAVSGGGKTTTTRELQKRLPNAKSLYFDDRNYDSDSGIEDTGEWIEAGADVNLWDLQRLADDIDKLKRENPDFIILDYPFGYRHNLIGPYLDYTVFIDTPFDIALARRVLRDFNEETKVTEIFEYMRSWLYEGGRASYLDGGEKTKARNADLIVDGSLPLNEIVECICAKVIAMKNTE